MLTGAKLQIPNPLPRARVQSTVGDGHADARADQRALDVRRHIVGAFGRVAVQRAFPVFRRQSVQRIAHIRAHVRVPVLVEAQTARRVLHEQVQDPGLVLLDFRQFFDDLVRDQVAAARAGGQGDLFLEPGHDGILF